jgi:hypothetical protein
MDLAPVFPRVGVLASSTKGWKALEIKGLPENQSFGVISLMQQALAIHQNADQRHETKICGNGKLKAGQAAISS